MAAMKSILEYPEDVEALCESLFRNLHTYDESLYDLFLAPNVFWRQKRRQLAS